ncbi:MAG TPA: pyruvate dehydrogenase (acetyl-transferring), homodimeric type [Candidatus Eisenbacteria bacterium]|nr:pyruvate dehydrogenase (acetyl-transferring), homodimeric type [Candidatus Eisenbacteria bacterium]
MLDDFKQQLPDSDPQETVEWILSLDEIVSREGHQRADFLLRKLLKRARQLQIGIPGLIQTRYINTISPEQEPAYPGDEEIELRIRRIIRWNAVAMVTRANHKYPGIGGHMSTYASSATLYEVGLNHFFRGQDGEGSGDQVFFQGHAAPGMYARAFLEGRISESQLDHFRREVVPGQGLSSYPHPRLMPEFWQFPTVSMGLGPINAIYQARFNRYLQARGIANTENSHVWCFLGDGECDEPEALGALTLASREHLDNLIFVVNCNLQRLDGPVRGNGKIIQELEAVFRGAGWNVLKVIWSRDWDPILARDVDGVLIERLNDTVDGQYQRYSIESGAYIREHLFGGDERLQTMVADYSDEQLQRLRRGGHDYRKVFAAYDNAVKTQGMPTVILAKTVKGWQLGAIEGRNITHQAKKMSEQELRAFRDRLMLPISDQQLAEDPPYYHPGMKSPEVEYILERRAALGGPLPRRTVRPKRIEMPEDKVFAEFSEGTPPHRQVSTTMAFTRLLRLLMSDPEIGKRVVPIIPDEARTFGMDPIFREVGIYSPLGQLYDPVDSKLLLSYTEKKDGQLLEEGITEAGSVASFTAAATSYATHGQPMIPFYCFYSMFGFQRTGDLLWALGDARGRGFLLGATAGRTTLNGEGLQHEDGHSHVISSVYPSVVSYDPAYAYELAIIVKDGLRRMFENDEDIFYYITLYNENYQMAAQPEGVEEGVLRGLYRYRAGTGKGPRVQIFGSGPMLLQALHAQEILSADYGVVADVWSATSYQQLRNDALEAERWNRLHPGETPRVPYVARALEGAEGPIVAVSDFTKAVPDMIARWMTQPFVPLGTDGFGRSDTREALRRFFEIDAESVVVAALSTLARQKKIPLEKAQEAMSHFGFSPEIAAQFTA